MTTFIDSLGDMAGRASEAVRSFAEIAQGRSGELDESVITLDHVSEAVHNLEPYVDPESVVAADPESVVAAVPEVKPTSAASETVAPVADLGAFRRRKEAMEQAMAQVHRAHTEPIAPVALVTPEAPVVMAPAVTLDGETRSRLDAARARIQAMEYPDQKVG
jgi:hypothetical protein